MKDLQYHEEVLLGMKAADLIEAKFPLEKQLVKLAELQRNLVLPVASPWAVQPTLWNSLKAIMLRRVW